MCQAVLLHSCFCRIVQPWPWIQNVSPPVFVCSNCSNLLHPPHPFQHATTIQYWINLTCLIYKKLLPSAKSPPVLLHFSKATLSSCSLEISRNVSTALNRLNNNSQVLGLVLTAIMTPHIIPEQACSCTGRKSPWPGHSFNAREAQQRSKGSCHFSWWTGSCWCEARLGLKAVFVIESTDNLGD